MTDRPLRIGVVCYPTYGGSGAVATELGRLLARRGHTIHFISYARPFRLIDDFHPNIYHHEISSESYPLFQGQLYTISAAVKIVDIIRHVGLDLLHVHYALPHAISAWMAIEMLAESRRIPTLTTLHGTDITLLGPKPSFYPAVKLGLDKSDGLTCVSHWLRRETCERFAVRGRMHVIYNFIDPDVFKPETSECHRAHFADPAEKLIMHISNFRPVKRVHDVIRVFARVAEQIPAKLLLIGDGPDQESAYVLSRELGVAERVIILGKQPNVECFLPLADCFLFPSDSESFGLAALEALACGVPVVGSRAGGLEEVIVDGQCGFLRPVGDVEAMARACMEILGNGELNGNMREAARRRAVEHFAADRIVPQYESIYHQLLQHMLNRTHGVMI